MQLRRRGGEKVPVCTLWNTRCIWPVLTQWVFKSVATGHSRPNVTFIVVISYEFLSLPSSQLKCDNWRYFPPFKYEARKPTFLTTAQIKCIFSIFTFVQEGASALFSMWIVDQIQTTWDCLVFLNHLSIQDSLIVLVYPVTFLAVGTSFFVHLTDLYVSM